MLRGRQGATAFAKEHESEILDFVAQNATISMSLLKGYGLRHYGRKKDANDQKLEHARILSIDNIRPLFVESGSAHPAFPREPDDGRITFLITVRLEIDLTIARPNYLAEPSVPIQDASALLEKPVRWLYPETEESLTVRRELQVSGSVAREEPDSGEFRDLRLTSAY